MYADNAQISHRQLFRQILTALLGVSLFAFHCASQDHVITIAVFPHFGVSGMDRICLFFPCAHWQDLFFILPVVKGKPIL